MTGTREKYVYKRKDGRWEARYVKGFSENGKPLFGVVYGNSREAVIQKRRDIIGDYENREQTVPQHLNLLILGAGTHGHDVREIAESLRVFKKISFLDDNIQGEHIIGKCKDALKFRGEYSCAFIAIGDNRIRKKYAKFLRESNYLLPNLISPMASVSTNVRLGDGIVIMPQGTVGAAEIGDCCIVATNSTVNSGATIEKFSHIDCGGIVAKQAKVPQGSWIKSGEIYQ